jgi:hypothetical protein
MTGDMKAEYKEGPEASENFARLAKGCLSGSKERRSNKQPKKKD